MAEGFPHSLCNLPPLIRLEDESSDEQPLNSFHCQSQLPQINLHEDGVGLFECEKHKTIVNKFTKKKYAAIEPHKNVGLDGNSPASATSTIGATIINKPTSTRKRKNWQECSLCANHSISVELKGHKNSCPFLDCTCEVCEVTRKKNYYSKLHQKFNRLRHEHNSTNLQGASENNIMNFPEDLRLEMEKDMSGSNLALLDKINRLCMPKFKH